MQDSTENSNQSWSCRFSYWLSSLPSMPSQSSRACSVPLKIEASGKLCQQVLNRAFKFCADLSYPRGTESVRSCFSHDPSLGRGSSPSSNPQGAPSGAERDTPPSQSNCSAPMGEPRGPPGRERRHHRQLIGQLLEMTGHKANDNAVPGRGWVTCLKKRGLRQENDFTAGNSGSPSRGSHASDDCESLGPELTHGDSAHNCIPLMGLWAGQPAPSPSW